MYVFGQLSMILWFLIDNPWKIIIEVDSYRFTVVRDRRGNVLTHHFVHVQHVQINPEQRILSFKKVFFSKDSLSQKILFLKRVFFTKYSLLKRFFYSEQNFSLKILFLKSFLFSKDSFSQSLPLQVHTCPIARHRDGQEPCRRAHLSGEEIVNVNSNLFDSW